MRKLQAGTIPTVEQTNAKPPEPRREWPRWKKVVAIAAVAGGALGLGACKESQSAPRPERHQPEAVCHSTTITGIPADSQSRKGVVAILEMDLRSGACGIETSDIASKLTEIATDEITGSELREEIVTVLKRSGWVRELVPIATYKGTEQQLKEKIVEMLIPQNTPHLLEEIAVHETTGSKLRERIVGILKGSGTHRPQFGALVGIAVNGITEPQLRDAIFKFMYKFSSENPDDCCDMALSLASSGSDENTDFLLRERIVEMLMRIRPCNFSGLAKIAAAESTEPHLRARIIRAFERAFNDAQDDVRQDAVSSIADIDDDIGNYYSEQWRARVINILEKACDHQRADVRLEALSGLVEIARDGDPLRLRIFPPLSRRIINVLVRGLNDGSEMVRSGASSYLSAILTDSELEFPLKEWVIGALGRAGAFSELTEIAYYLEPSLRDQIVRILEKASTSKDEGIRLDAVKGLGEISDLVSPRSRERVTAILQRALDDSSEDVRSSASEALRLLERGTTYPNNLMWHLPYIH